LVPSPDIYPRTDGMFQIGLDDETACGPVVRGGARRAGAAPLDGGPAMTSPVIIAKLINDDVAQAGDIVARGRSPVNVSWCRQVTTLLPRSGCASRRCCLGITHHCRRLLQPRHAFVDESLTTPS